MNIRKRQVRPTAAAAETRRDNTIISDVMVTIIIIIIFVMMMMMMIDVMMMDVKVKCDAMNVEKQQLQCCTETDGFLVIGVWNLLECNDGQTN